MEIVRLRLGSKCTEGEGERGTDVRPIPNRPLYFKKRQVYVILRILRKTKTKVSSSVKSRFLFKIVSTRIDRMADDAAAQAPAKLTHCFSGTIYKFAYDIKQIMSVASLNKLINK